MQTPPKPAIANAKPVRSCESLATMALPNTTIESAAIDPANPNVCRVQAFTTHPPSGDRVRVWVAIPTSNWNGRFMGTGGGGFSGGSAGGVNQPVASGFAAGATDTGHEGASGSFALKAGRLDWQSIRNNAHVGIHEMTVTGKALTQALYGVAPKFSYFNGCSTGGRQALTAAQRYPDDFDGIVANAPWVDQTGFTVGAMWNQKAMAQAPVTPAKMVLVAQKVMEKCDALDGLKDGLVDDPRVCQFDAARDVPACAAGADGADCLTASQAATINAVYSGPKSKGKPFMSGFMPGSEAVNTAANGTTQSGWVGAIVPAQPGAKPADFNLAEGVMKYLILDPPKADYDAMTFDYDKDTALVARWSKLADAKDADLSKFKKSGGKLIMTYGWADQILQPMMGVKYYEAVTAKHGKSTTDFARLFMVPGMAHCQGGVGPDQNDAVSAVIDWVEKNKAPDSLLASRIVKGAVIRSRPLCPYPQVARYKGQGSIDEAANFSCVAPR